MAHDTSTVNATVVSAARAAALSVASSVVLTMSTHGIPQQLPRKFPLPRTSAVIATATRQSPQTSAEVRRNFYGCCRGLPPTSTRSKLHGNPRPSAAIAMAQISEARQIPRTYAEFRGDCHGRSADFRGRPNATSSRTSAAITMANIRRATNTTDVCGSPRQLPASVSAHAQPQPILTEVRVSPRMYHGSPRVKCHGCFR